MLARDLSLKKTCSEFSTPSLLGNSGVVKVPGRVHHELEVLVVITAHGDIVVVLNPFILVNSSVSGSFVGKTVVHLEGVQEFEKDIILLLLS